MFSGVLTGRAWDEAIRRQRAREYALVKEGSSPLDLLVARARQTAVDPFNPYATIDLTLALMEAKDFALAARELETARTQLSSVKNKQEYLRLLFVLASCNVDIGDKAAALGNLYEAYHLDPAYVASHIDEYPTLKALPPGWRGP
jgi:hypothetical protein